VPDIFRLSPRRFFLLLLWLLMWSQPIFVRAQETPLDPPWRQTLTCDQSFRGVEYCTDDTGKIHVLVVDTHSPGVRLEYVIAEGVNRAGVFGECNDVNRPTKGLVRGGCAEPGNPDYFPVMSLEQAATLAQKRYEDVALVIDSDYGAGTQNEPTSREHGPEGLTIVRGKRLDGPTNSDYDNPIQDPNLNNAVLRPWLAISRDAPLQVKLGQFAPGADDGNKPYAWVYTGVGGGPWLIRDGQIDDTQIQECTAMNGTHPCVSTVAQTGVGLSQDKRWLYLVLIVGQDAEGLAHFLREQMDVWEAIKFDGGGSSQLWYNGRVIERGDGRQLSQYLAVIAGPGEGIEIVEPSPEPLPAQGNFLQRLWRTLERETQNAWETIRSRSERFLAEQWDQLQRGIDRQLAEWQKSLEQWMAEQQQRWEQEAQRQADELMGQLCVGNWLIGSVVVVAAIGLGRRRQP